jgi:hypothetical protein
MLVHVPTLSVGTCFGPLPRLICPRADSADPGKPASGLLTNAFIYAILMFKTRRTRPSSRLSRSGWLFDNPTQLRGPRLNLLANLTCLWRSGGPSRWIELRAHSATHHSPGTLANNSSRVRVVTQKAAFGKKINRASRRLALPPKRQPANDLRRWVRAPRA